MHRQFAKRRKRSFRNTCEDRSFVANALGDPVCGRNEGIDGLSSRIGLRSVGRLGPVKSGKKGFKRPGLNETGRAALRLVHSRQWSTEEISQAFAEDLGMGE